ncbi:hypothetical protein [Pediococcus inopinatus]
MLFSIALKLIVGLLGLLVVVRFLGKKAISECSYVNKWHIFF